MRCVVSPMRYRIPSRYAAALQQSWPVPFGLRASLLHSLIGIRLPVSSLLTRTSCPGYGGRTVLRLPCLRTRGGHSVAAKWLSTGHLVYVRTRHEYMRCGTWFARLAHSRRSCCAFAGRDSLSLGLMVNRLRCYMDSSNEPITERYLALGSLLVSARSRAAWPSDWLPCHPARTNGGIRDRRFHFCTLITDQQP